MKSLTSCPSLFIPPDTGGTGPAIASLLFDYFHIILCGFPPPRRRTGSTVSQFAQSGGINEIQRTKIGRQALVGVLQVEKCPHNWLGYRAQLGPGLGRKSNASQPEENLGRN
jgi:hypothetical protein